MTLPELSIRRHVLAFMLSAVLVLFGVISALRLGVDRLPSIDFPVVSVTTTLRGANPDIIDASITSIVEGAVNSISGIDHIQSTSSPSVSVVAVTFSLDKNINVAFNEVQAKVNQVLRNLPRDADPPVVAKVETGAQPVVWLALKGDRTLQQLNEYARNRIKKRLETIDGVGEVRIGGERKRVIRVQLNPPRMAALGVTVQDLNTAFQKEHVQLPGGFLVGRQSENLMKLDLEFHDVAAMRNMIVAYKDSAPVRLSDVGTVEDGLEDFRQLARFKGEPAVGIGVVKIPNSNTVAIIDKVMQRLDNEIIPQLPPGMSVEISSNDAIFINEMIGSLKEHIVLGTILAALVVLLFLKSMRSTIIIALAIPVSLLGAIAVMYFSGFTFNALTLLALLLLIGVVVDDAIVVLENIFRHREHLDPDPISAAVNGSKQVVFAVIAATLTLVSIFAPVIFMGGIIGKFFQSFAVVVTFGVLVSLFVSLTLTPMLCSRYLRVAKRHGALYERLDRWFHFLDGFYRQWLDRALHYPWRTVGIAGAIVATSLFFFATIGKGFAPDEDEGRFFVRVRAPLGSSIEYTDGRLREVEAVLSKEPSVWNYFSIIGFGSAGQVNQGLAIVRMLPRGERDISQAQLIDKLRAKLAQIPGARAFPSPPSIVGGGRGEPLQFVLSGPNLNEVARLSDQLTHRLADEPGIGRLDQELQLDLPQLELELDRTRAAQLGLTAQDIGLAINSLVGGVDVGKYNDPLSEGQRYDVRMKAATGHYSALTDLDRIFLRTHGGQMIRLDTIARFKQSLGAAVISRFDLQYASNFYGNPTIPLGEAISKVQAAGADLPLGYTVKMIGQAEELGKTAKAIGFAFLLAMALLYMVLASQFNSFVQPFIIMLAQPLAIVGGIFGLWLFNRVFGVSSMTLNIYSMIGLLLLIGLVAKNSILLVDLTNQLRLEGKSIREALREACPIRMRPVLMTSLTIVLAELPAAISLGAGAQTNGPLAVAVIGGMISSTLLTLIVVPAVYLLLEERLAAMRSNREAKTA